MGLKIDKNGKPVPITPYKGSWAEQQAKLKEARNGKR